MRGRPEIKGFMGVERLGQYSTRKLGINKKIMPLFLIGSVQCLREDSIKENVYHNAKLTSAERVNGGEKNLSC